MNRKPLSTLGAACLSLLLSASHVSAGPIQIERVASGVPGATSIVDPGDGSGRLFITQQTGQIRVYRAGTVLPVPFLDISALVDLGTESGLLGLVFHPDYESNGFFYVDYIRDTPTGPVTVVARYSVSADPNVADPGSAVDILAIPRPGNHHNGGQLQFGPEGYLYISNGDGGGFGDPDTNRAQKLDSPFGKLLRIDVDGGFPYVVPPDNPFVEVAGAVPEIWAWGLRNPWRFSFDRMTGDLFIGDVGAYDWEEIDFQPATSAGGENYGWPYMEGTHCFTIPTLEGEDCNDGTLVLPIAEYGHTEGCSVTAGYRYRGPEIPALNGTFLYADYCQGRIWGATRQGDGSWGSEVLLETGLQITTFGEDTAGNLYLAHYQGEMYRVVPSFGISPPSGTYAATQSFDLTLMLRTPGASVTGGSATLDGVDVSGQLSACFVPGTIAAGGGTTLRCGGLRGELVGPGLHVLGIALELSDGSTVADTATWQVVENTEP